MSADSAAARPGRTLWGSLFQGLQKMGRSLQLPIAVLPAAGILNRLGQPDVFGDDGLGWTNVSKVMAGAGGALLDGQLGLPLLFCVGVAIGMAKKSDGSTALAGLVGFLVYYNVLRQFPKDCTGGTNVVPGIGCQAADHSVSAFTYQNPGVFGGIVLGLLTAFFWVRFHRTKLVTGSASSTGGGWCRSSCRSWRSRSRRWRCGSGRRSAPGSSTSATG